jgi:mRNA interferase HigB
MRVHLIKKQVIEDYIAGHATGRSSFETWLSAIKHADWVKPDDIRQTFGSADLLRNGSDRVVFNISGNNYRMICKYYFGSFRVHLFICWIGTHTDYNELCSNGDQFTVNIY